jgi:hypothetical protein
MIKAIIAKRALVASALNWGDARRRSFLFEAVI